MIGSIHFDDEFLVQAHKIGYILAYNMLSVELNS